MKQIQSTSEERARYARAVALQHAKANFESKRASTNPALVGTCVRELAARDAAALELARSEVRAWSRAWSSRARRDAQVIAARRAAARHAPALLAAGRARRVRPAVVTSRLVAKGPARPALRRAMRRQGARRPVWSVRVVRYGGRFTDDVLRTLDDAVATATATVRRSRSVQLTHVYRDNVLILTVRRDAVAARRVAAACVAARGGRP